MNRTALVLVVICIASPARAQELRTHVFDREFFLDSVAVGLAYAADEIITEDQYDRCPYCRELNWYATGSRNELRIAATSAALDAGQMVLAYEWKKHVKNRHLNWMWRAIPAYLVEEHLPRPGTTRNIHPHRLHSSCTG